MTLFPTQYSTLSSSALRDVLAQRYEIAFAACHYLLRGVSDTYLLEQEATRYILKIYREMHRSHEEILGEVELLNALKAEGGRVAAPLADRDGAYLQSFQAAEGIRYGVLFEFAKGASIQQLTDAHLHTVGREMAMLHQVTTSITLQHTRPVFTFDVTVRKPLKTVAPAFAGLAKAYDYLCETGEAVIKKLESFDLSTFSYGYCHFDFLPKNFHFDDAGNITFFDFDFTGRSFIAYDIMSFWVHFALHADFKRLTDDEADRQFAVFLKAYREIRPFSDQELRAVPYLCFTWFVYFLEYHYLHFDDFSNPSFTPRSIQDRVALIMRLTDRYCSL